MAAPTPTIRTFQYGHSGLTIFTATWSTTDNFADQVVVDLSGLTTYTSALKVQKVQWQQSTGIALTLEFDDDSADETILKSAKAVAGSTEWNCVDFCANGMPGIVYQGSGGSGDLVMTTTGAASADVITMYVWWYAN